MKQSTSQRIHSNNETRVGLKEPRSTIAISHFTLNSEPSTFYKDGNAIEKHWNNSSASKTDTTQGEHKSRMHPEKNMQDKDDKTAVKFRIKQF